MKKSLRYYGRDNLKVERISKKYQWIGLHEYVGYLSDTLLFYNWGEDIYPLRGAWELYTRDYNPNLAIIDKNSKVDNIEYILPSGIKNSSSVEYKQAWIKLEFESFIPFLTMQDEKNQWIFLKNHHSFREEPQFGSERFKSAEMSQWIDIRVFLVPKSELSETLESLRGKDFFGNGVDVPDVHQCWVSEYPWHPSLIGIDEDCLEGGRWLHEIKERAFLPVCSISNDSNTILLPAPSLHRGMGEALGTLLSAPQLNANGDIFIDDQKGRCIFKSDIHDEKGLLVEKSAMMQYLRYKKYALVWAVLSEKMAWDGHTHAGGIAIQNAVYVLEDDGEVSGGHTVRIYDAPERFTASGSYRQEKPSVATSPNWQEMEDGKIKITLPNNKNLFIAAK